jgi:outer membrane lipoprotein-sorting protein
LLSYQDSQAIGTMTLSDGTSYPITIKTKGTQETRVELQKSKGPAVRIVNQGTGVIERPNGSVLWLQTNNTLAEYVHHIPLLSILSDYQNAASIQLVYQGVTQVNGQNTDAIAVSFVPTTDPVQGPIYASMTQTTFYVDQATGLVDKIQYTNFSENDTTSTQSIEIYFSNYQVISGISAPFTQTVYIGGSLDSTVVLTSISFNVGLPDSDFTLPPGR